MISKVVVVGAFIQEAVTSNSGDDGADDTYSDNRER